MEVNTIFKPQELPYITKLSIDEILRITKQFVSNKKDKYEIDENSILYDSNSHVTHESVWYIDIISVQNKLRWPDAYETIAISDKTGKVIYAMNDHGVVIDKFI